MKSNNDGFDYWWKNESPYQDKASYTLGSLTDCKKAWIAACDFKQKEIDELEKEQVRHIEILKDEFGTIIKSLQAENAKLKYCLKEIANEDYRGNRSSASVKAYMCLKELDEKL